MLSGYRMMWMLVLFDLPVGTKEERRAATQFRNALLDKGFQMCQFSVYIRFCGSKEEVDRHTKQLQDVLPPGGLVQMFSLTDKQYGNGASFRGRRRERIDEIPEQYVLF